jgi:heme oxygenase
MSRDNSSVLKMSIKKIAEDYEKKWVNDEFLYIEDAIEAAIIKFIELRGVAEATDLKALADQLEADLNVYWSTAYRENIIAQLRAKLEEK